MQGKGLAYCRRHTHAVDQHAAVGLAGGSKRMPMDARAVVSKLNDDLRAEQVVVFLKVLSCPRTRRRVSWPRRSGTQLEDRVSVEVEIAPRSTRRLALRAARRWPPRPRRC
jgi:hypothetical protein